MTITTAAVLRIAHRDAPDVRVIVTFAPSDPEGLTLVEVAGEEPHPARYLALVDAAAARLAVYVQDYRAAAEGDTEGEQ